MVNQIFIDDELRYRREGKFDLADNQNQWNQALTCRRMLLVNLLTDVCERENLHNYSLWR